MWVAVSYIKNSFPRFREVYCRYEIAPDMVSREPPELGSSG